MPRASLTKRAVARNMTGYNLTDSAHFATLVVGAGNGGTWAHLSTDLIVLKNDEVGAATFAFEVRQPADFTTFGITVADATIVVAAGKTVVIRAADLLQSTAGAIIVECDVAGKVLVLDLSN